MTGVDAPNVPLAELTTLRLGGTPRHLLEPANETELVATLSELWSSGSYDEVNDSVLLLGGGSNVLASDSGFDGTVVRLITRGIKVQAEGSTYSAEPADPADAEKSGGSVLLRVQAGEPWDALVAYAVACGWGGIEALSGIPGTVGAVPVQNVGAYGVEVAEAIESVDVLEADTLARRTLNVSELALAYRSSIFKKGYRAAIVAVTLRLEHAATSPVRHPQLASALGVSVGTEVPLSTVREQVLALRASKGMVLDAGDHDTWSAGSFFTNPVVPLAVAHGLPEEAPRWPVADAEQPDDGPLLVKLSAAWLIEHAGIGRGFSLPGSHAAVSHKHTLALTNQGGATARELIQLAEFIQLRVQSDFGVVLHPEPTLVGFDGL